MKTFTITEAKKRIDEVFKAIAEGQHVEVTRRRRTVFNFEIGESVVVRRPGNPAKLAEAARWLKRHRPRAIRPGEMTIEEERNAMWEA